MFYFLTIQERTKRGETDNLAFLADINAYQVGKYMFNLKSYINI